MTDDTFGDGSLWSLPDFIRANEPPFAPSQTTTRMDTNDDDKNQPAWQGPQVPLHMIYRMIR